MKPIASKETVRKTFYAVLYPGWESHGSVCWMDALGSHYEDTDALVIRMTVDLPKVAYPHDLEAAPQVDVVTHKHGVWAADLS